MRINGPSNPCSARKSAIASMVSIRLADQWPFEPRNPRRPRQRSGVSIRLADQWPFEQKKIARSAQSTKVSIRLADQWPFELRLVWHRKPFSSGCFNPPCGSMALRTRRLCRRWPSWGLVSIRLADQWPFERYGSRPDGGRNAVSIRLADQWPFEPPLRRLRPSPSHCFNPPCGSMALRTRRPA